MGPQAKECGQTLDARIAKEMDSALKSPRNIVLPIHLRLLTPRTVK